MKKKPKLITYQMSMTEEEFKRHLDFVEKNAPQIEAELNALKERMASELRRRSKLEDSEEVQDISVPGNGNSGLSTGRSSKDKDPVVDSGENRRNEILEKYRGLKPGERVRVTWITKSKPSYRTDGYIDYIQGEDVFVFSRHAKMHLNSYPKRYRKDLSELTLIEEN